MTEISEKEIEIASKAYADATGYYVEFHRGLSSPSADQIRKGVRAALESAAHARAEAEAEGMVLVPREPTEMMVYAGREAMRKARTGRVCGQTIEACFKNEYARELACYRAMIAAAEKEGGNG